MKHSELPWEYGKASNYEGFYIAPKNTLPTLASVERCGRNIDVLTHNFPGKTEANAAFIVKACNNHYKLIEALKELVEAEWMVSHDWGGDRKSVIKKAEQAIKEAE